MGAEAEAEAETFPRLTSGSEAEAEALARALGTVGSVSLRVSSEKRGKKCSALAYVGQ